MKETELWQRLESTWAPGYYRVWASEFSLADLGNRTVAQALADGVPSKTSGGRSGRPWSCRPGTADARRTGRVTAASLRVPPGQPERPVEVGGVLAAR